MPALLPPPHAPFHRRCRPLSRTVILSFLFVTSFVLGPSPALAQNADHESLLELHGSLQTRYRVRWTGEESDQDLDQYLRLEAGDRAGDPVTAAVYLRLQSDLDSGGDRSGHHSFDDIFDTFEAHVTTRLYYGYADLHHVPGFDVARIGRQLLVETPRVFHLDGAIVESVDLDEDLRLRLGAYGGVPVHFFESSARGDILFGGFLSSQPWRGGKLRLDATHIEDEAAGSTESDDLFAIAISQRLETGLGLEFRHSRLGSKSRHFEARADYIAPELDLQVQLFFYDQPTTQHAATPELDPFSSALHDLSPHTLWSGTAHQGLGDRFTVSLGHSRRDLLDQSDESPFNHEYTRSFATLSWEDWPWGGAGGFLSADDWDAAGDRSRTLSGELSQEFGQRLRASFGSLYALYEYDFLLEEERQQVRTLYLHLEGPLRGRTRVRLEYEYERDPFDEYHRVALRLTHTF